jgi:transporter family-2 protein
MVYEGLALIIGAGIALMVTANGLLAAQFGLWTGTLITHACGLLTVSGILLIKRKPVALRAPGVPWYLYLAGVSGVVTTALNSFCFEPMGAALMLAMVVVGQLLGSCLIDHFGWFGMRRYPFWPGKLAGFAIMGLGLLLMTLWQSAGSDADHPLPQAAYAALALGTGVNLAFTNTFNASLGRHIGVFSGTLVNYITGIVTSLLCALAFGQWVWPATAGGLSPFLFAGGVLGVRIISGTNTVFPRISVVYATVLMFVGQIVAGMAIDAAGGMPVTALKAVGCAMIPLGLLCNMRLDKRRAAAQAAK